MEIFLEPQFPPPLLYVVGETPISDAVIAQAESLGFAFASVRTLDGQQPEGAVAVIVASHGSDEPESIRAALDADVRYIGLVASRRRGEAVLDAMDLTKRNGTRAHAGRPRYRGADRRGDRTVDHGRGGPGNADRGSGGPRRPRASAVPGRLTRYAGWPSWCGPTLRIARSMGWSTGTAAPRAGTNGTGVGTDVFVTGLVLAAGGSRRLGQPKQLLAYRGTTLLGATFDMARGCGFDQLLVTLAALRPKCGTASISGTAK